MRHIRLMLIDDNATFLRIVSRFLQQNKDVVVVGTATGGEAALARAQDLQPHVVLLDLAMPGLSGFDTIPRLRQLLPEVRIIVLTLLNVDGYRQAALAAGADDFVSKSAINTDLLPAIRRAAMATARVPGQ